MYGGWTQLGMATHRVSFKVTIRRVMEPSDNGTILTMPETGIVLPRAGRRAEGVSALLLRYTLIPTSIILGLGAAPLWSAQSTYLTITGNRQAEKEGHAGKDVVTRYFGVFFLIFQSSGVWGNLISSLVFGQTPTQGQGRCGCGSSGRGCRAIWPGLGLSENLAWEGMAV